MNGKQIISVVIMTAAVGVNAQALHDPTVSPFLSVTGASSGLVVPNLTSSSAVPTAPQNAAGPAPTQTSGDVDATRTSLTILVRTRWTPLS